MSAQRKGGWGSLLGSAVAGLESRLDTILADDDQASAKSRAAEKGDKPEAAGAVDKQRLQVNSGRYLELGSRTTQRDHGTRSH